MIQLIRDLQQNDFKTMYKQQGISYLGLFGSFARGEATPQSDIDLLIDFDETISLFDLAHVKLYFQDTLGKKVDLAMRGSLKKSLEPYIMKDLITVYEKN
ncbi:MAG: nucleotidyltransferase family protein [Patescibacteria group bacterium]|nr:nucleotidyltransferase family protein [Patescibacteria group bacterium]